MTVRDIKRVALAVGIALIVVWAVLLLFHILFALVWIFFWIGAIAVLVAVVLHALERFV